MGKQKKNPVKVYNHSRKGKIVGTIINDDGDDWVTIKIAEKFEPKFLTLSRGGYEPEYEPGEEITVRKSLLTEEN